MESDRLEELILYIASRMEQDQHVGRGRIKLAKLLYRIDFEAYARWGQSVSGTRYHADRLGPVPSGELLATRDLIAQGRFDWRNEWDKQELPIALDAPQLDVFAPREVALADEQLDLYREVSGDAMVEEAHRFAGWVHAWDEGRGSRAPVLFESIFWDDTRQEPEPWENEHARSLAEKHGL